MEREGRRLRLRPQREREHHGRSEQAKAHRPPQRSRISSPGNTPARAACGARRSTRRRCPSPSALRDPGARATCGRASSPGSRASARSAGPPPGWCRAPARRGPEPLDLRGVVRHEATLSTPRWSSMSARRRSGARRRGARGGDSRRPCRRPRLQVIGADLVREADASALLPEVEHGPAARRTTSREGGVELLLAVALERAEDLAGDALGVDSDRHGFAGRFPHGRERRVPWRASVVVVRLEDVCREGSVLVGSGLEASHCTAPG